MAKPLKKIFSSKKLNLGDSSSFSTTFKKLKQYNKNLTINTINQNVRLFKYDSTSPIHLRALEIERELKKGVKKPFQEVFKAHLGDCQEMGQKPITFIRQLLALCSYNKLFDDPKIPEDVKQRAKLILRGCNGGSVGSYTESEGISVIRNHVAEFITKRDGFPSKTEDIYIVGGVSDAIKNIMKLFLKVIKGKNPGLLIPIPTFHLYSALGQLLNLTIIPYYLNESDNWSLDLKHLKQQVNQARNYCNPRLIVVINPGDPTGQVLERNNIAEIIKFAHSENLVIFADEVYQESVYDPGSKFHSFKKIMNELGDPYNKQECFSTMSVSKGFSGECGLRGGYVEAVNLNDEVKSNLNKLIIMQLCSSTLGQIVVDAVVCPPNKGDPSHDLYMKEKQEILNALKERAKLVVDAFNKSEGFKCNVLKGAMCAFPKISLPKAVLAAAATKGQNPDEFYCFELLENTGIATIPGSVFGQEPGTYHLRTTILLPTDKIISMLGIFQDFHNRFLQRYN